MYVNLWPPSIGAHLYTNVHVPKIECLDFFGFKLPEKEKNIDGM